MNNLFVKQGNAGSLFQKQAGIGRESGYKAKIGNTHFIMRKMLYGFLTLSSGMLFVYCGSYPFSFNMRLYAGIPQYAALFLLLCLLVTLYSYIVTGREMTAWMHKITSLYLITLSRITALCMTICALAGVLSTILNREEIENVIAELAGAGGFLLCAVAMFSVYRLEKQLVYELVPKPGWFRNKLSEKQVKARFFH
jgi:hypothetical protein